MTARVLRLGTRRSALAMAQADTIARGIESAAREVNDDLRVELVGISSFGDESTAPLSSLGGTGVFVSRLRQAIVEGEVDAAVHSLKDLPTAPVEGITLAAIPEREDSHDVVVSRPGLRLVNPAQGMDDVRVRIGTGSPRRAAQLAALARQQGFDLEICDIRGNVDSRIGRVGAERDDGAALDAVVLAHAGLIRLGRQHEISEVLPFEAMLPAPGQGALALERRSDAMPWVSAALERVDHLETRVCVVAERTVLAAVEAGCAAPLGALAVINDGPDDRRTMWLRALVARLDGSVVLRRETTVDVESWPGVTPQSVQANAVAAALEVASQLLADGAGDLLETRIGATR